MAELGEIINKYSDLAISYRRHFHKYPELSNSETETTIKIAEILTKMGITAQKHDGNGVTAIISGNSPGRCIALRCDIDALPISETTSLPFGSVHSDVCHACGHDMHIAILLGAAHVLNEMRGLLSGSIKLIFQPAEEDQLNCGAIRMIEHGVLENPKVDAIIALHVWPQYKTGSAAIRDGAMMASTDLFKMTVKGKKGHGSAPEDCVDAIAIASSIITSMQTIVSRNVSPHSSSVISVGKINGGSRYNIIADKVELEGICRTLDPKVRDILPKLIERTATGVAQAMGGECDIEYFTGYPPTINNYDMFNLTYGVMKDVLGQNALIAPNSSLSSEDFSYYCEQVPGAYFWLGVQNPNEPFSPLHNSSFSPDEAAIRYGIEIMAKSAITFLNK